MNEQLLRDALERQAARAPDPARMLAGIEPRYRTARRRRVSVSLLAAVATVAALTVPAYAFTQRTPAPAQPAAAATATATATPEPLPEGVYPLRFRPGWLPAGAVESERTVTAGHLTRGWIVPGGTQRIRFAVNPWPPMPDNGQTVDINGATGRLSADGRAVTWSRDGAILSVSLYDGSSRDAGDQPTLLRIARSVVPDPGTVRPPVRFGWLPASYAPGSTGVAGESPQKWDVQLHSSTTADSFPGGGPWVHLRFGFCPASGSCQENPRAVPTKIRDRPGSYVSTDGKGSFVQVRLDGGTLLLVYDSDDRIGRDDLVRIADTLVIDPDPQVSWVGAG